MKKTIFIMLLIGATSFADMDSDILVPSSESTVHGQRLVSSEVDYTYRSKPYEESHSYFIALAKSNATAKALKSCQGLSSRVTKVSPWTVHKIIGCNSFVCYGTEYGKYSATALFECL